MKQRSTNSRNGSGSGAQAVERAIAVLQTLGDSPWELGLAELSSELALNKTTVLRLLGALERSGFVSRDILHHSYRLGPSLIRLGTQARRSVGLHEAARPLLESLAASTGEAVTLEVLAGEEVLILDEVRGRYLLGSSPEVGTHWPAHATSTGKVLLAAARFEAGSAHRVASSAPRGRLHRLTPNTITSRAVLDRELEKIWRVGFAVASGELEIGFVAVGAPIHNAEGRVVAAIGLSGPKARIHSHGVAQLAVLIRHAADRVSERLGAAPDLHHSSATSVTADRRARADLSRRLSSVPHAPLPARPSTATR
jgi:DNA-binding IclR family transcriptional regulator